MTTRRELTQAERVLAVLRRSGERGTYRLEWSGPDVVDGGPPILHLAGRIEELRKAGLRIATRSAPDRLARYVLEPQQLVDLGRVDVAVDLTDFEPSQAGADAMCACPRPLPAPRPHGELRCTRCGLATRGWSW